MILNNAKQDVANTSAIPDGANATAYIARRCDEVDAVWKDYATLRAQYEALREAAGASVAAIDAAPRYAFFDAYMRVEMESRATGRWSEFANVAKALAPLRSALSGSSTATKEPTLSPEWCMEVWYRVNPGARSTLPSMPSLYLLDFARAVLGELPAPSVTTSGTEE